MALAGFSSAQADTVANYTLGFEERVDIKDPNFIPALNWQHASDGAVIDGVKCYMTYTYYTDKGVDDSGCLYASDQEAGSYYDTEPVFDCIVTPVVSGQVSIKVKKYNSYSYLKVYGLNASGRPTTSKQFANVTATTMGSDWYTVTFNVDEPQRVALNAHKVYMDDFSAESAEIEDIPSFTIVSADPSATTGVIRVPQNADGSVTLKYSVTIKNNGMVDLVAGETENYSISLVHGTDDTVIGTTEVPVNLARGETSEPFDVTATVAESEIRSIWPYSSASKPINLLNNLTGSLIFRAGTQVVEYEPKFELKIQGSGASVPTTYAAPFGISTEASTINFQLKSTGTADLQVRSLSIPEGYTTTVELPEGEFIIAAGEMLELPLTRPATPGRYMGNLQLVYVNKAGADVTYTLPLSGATLEEGQWGTSFNNNKSTVVWGPGSIAQNGISNDKYSLTAYDMYDHWAVCSNSNMYVNADNKYITPKMHMEAGQEMYFETGKNTTVDDKFGLKVFVSTDRKNWGEPVMTVLRSDLSDTAFHPYTWTATETGDFYVAFELYGMKLDNIIAFQRANVPYDFEISEFTLPETAKKGEEVTAKIKVLNTTAAEAADYTVKLYAGDEEIGSATSVKILEDAKGYKEFTVKHTFDPEVTTDYAVRMDMAFTDGTVVTSGTKQLKVTNEPEFGFYEKDNHGTKWHHDSTKTPVNFGKTSTQGIAKEYEFYNWGTAPLTVNSISVPEGFSVSITEAEVPVQIAVPVVLSFTAETAGTYSGNLEINYINGEGEAAVYTLAMNGIMLEPGKWYASFDDGTTNGLWPAGSLHQSNVSLENSNTALEPNMVMTCSTAKNGDKRMFITPKLHSNGEIIQMDLCRYNSTYSTSAGVEIYIAATREGLLDADGKRTLLAEYKGEPEEGELSLGTTPTTEDITIPEGDWYLGIAPYSRGRVDEIYGLSLVPAEGLDLMYESAVIPSDAIQNNLATAHFRVYNVGLEEVPADAYHMELTINGQKQDFEGEIALPAVNTLSNPTDIPVTFRYPKTGTYEAVLALVAGDIRLESAPAEITFAKEVLNAEVQVGENKTRGNDGPVDYYYKHSDIVMVYPAEMLGLSGGETITRLAFRGYNNFSTVRSSTHQVYTQLIDETSIGQPSSKPYSAEGMTEQRNDATPVVIPKDGTDSNLIDLFAVELAEPIVYEAGKSLKVYVHMDQTEYMNNSNWKFALTDTKTGWRLRSDSNIATASWSAVNIPTLWLGLEATPSGLSGTVTDREGNAVAGALVNLTSTDGDNVQYEAVADETGAYTLEVIQNNRTYDAVAAAEGLAEFEDGLTIEGTIEKDFVLRPVFRIHGQATHTGGAEAGVVYLDGSYTTGYNAITLPVALDEEEIEAIFGDATVLAFAGERVEGTNAVAQFAQTSSMEAGVPYLVYLRGEQPEAQMFRTKDVAETLNAVNGTRLTWTPTSAPTDLTPDMFVMEGDNFVPASQIVAPTAMRSALPTVPAYSAYIKGSEGVQTVGFTNDADLPSAVEAIAEREGDDMIYTLDGIRVKNPAKGLYIINGKVFLVK